MMKRTAYILLIVSGILFVVYLLNKSDKTIPAKEYVAVSTQKIELCKTCPPGFQLNEENKCISVNLYSNDL